MMLCQRFSLSYEGKTVLLELDSANPQSARRLLIKRISSLAASDDGNGKEVGGPFEQPESQTGRDFLMDGMRRGILRLGTTI
jgi:hypothetical protein